MKKFYIVLSIACSFVFIAAEDGVGAGQNRDRSGSPDGDSVCQACHSAGAFSPEISLSITNQGGEEVTSYIPGQTYLLEYTVNGTSGNPSAFGFQGTALTDDNENAGLFMNPGTQTQIETVTNNNVTNRSVVEHSSPTASGTWQAEWQAPANFEGDVTFYYSGVAVNGNFGTSGDGYVGGTSSLSPDFSSSVNSLEDQFYIKGSQSSQGLSLEVNSDESTSVATVYGVNGQELFIHTWNGEKAFIPSDKLANGISIVTVQSGSVSKTLKLFSTK